MKKSLFILLAVLLLLPLPTVSSAAGEEWSSYPFEISEIINLSDTGAAPGPNSAHGNHQTRTVHTSHGDFAAYITGSYNDSKGTVDTWSLFKIDSEGGEAEVVFTGEKYYDSSQVSLLVDKDENVWAITASSDNYRHMKTEGVDVRAHRYDAKTGEISSHTSFIAGGAQDGYGYATSFYDPNNDRIIVLLAGGDYKNGSATGASFNWAIFDTATNRWQRHVYSARIPSRHCYMYGYVDDGGGLMIIAQRDIKCSSLGYPEIGNDTGIFQADRDYMWDNYIFRWSANYCWDQLDLYYIPDVKKTDLITYNVVTADYSRVLGTEAERCEFQNRLTNYYPENQNNNGGDLLTEKTANGRTLLHITYNSAYIQAAMYRPNAQESIWYHQVWDITDPAAAEKLYNAPIVTEKGIADGVSQGGGYSFRLYQSKDSQLYLISVFDPETDRTYYKDGATKTETQYDSLLSVYKVIKTDDGYSYKKLPKTVSLPGGGAILNISSHRGGSAVDGTVNILYMNNDGNGDYIFTQLSLSDLTVTLGDINGDGEINGKDSNLIKQIICGVIKSSDMQFFAADLSLDENINGNDANLLTRLLAGENAK
ncbi:MAG: hypothetical protein IJA52_04070 [Clostridia bacterium]|nr:hypothetical protein [Clostridia bacterium]